MISIKIKEGILIDRLEYLISLLQKNEAKYSLSEKELIFYPFNIENKIPESELEEFLFKCVSRYKVIG